MCFQKWFCVFVLINLTKMASAQQLVLGNSPSNMNKSAVLELNADRQGLLLPRITDTVAINSLNPPDGMVVYFVPAKCLLVRTSGYWTPLAPATSAISIAAGASGSDFNISGSPVLSGGTVTLNLPSASATARGLLTSADWNSFNSKGNGTVTSVGLSLPSIFTVSNSPVTSSGTLTGTLASQAQNLVLASPNGSAGVPSFRSLVKSDLPATVVHNDQANGYTAGMKQTFRSNTTSAGLSFGGVTADPGTVAAGDLWYRPDLGKIKYYDGTTVKILATEANNISGTLNYLSKFTPDGTSLGNSKIYDNGTNIGIGTTAPSNLVHIKGTSNPLRVEGLSQITSTNTLVVDANGVVGTSPALQLSFIMKGTFRLDLPSINNNGNTSVTVSVPGAQVGDNVVVTPSGELSNTGGTGLVIIGYSYVSAAGQVTIRFVNPTNTTTDVSAMDFYITVLR